VPLLAGNWQPTLLARIALQFDCPQAVRRFAPIPGQAVAHTQLNEVSLTRKPAWWRPEAPPGGWSCSAPHGAARYGRGPRHDSWSLSVSSVPPWFFFSAFHEEIDHGGTEDTERENRGQRVRVQMKGGRTGPPEPTSTTNHHPKPVGADTGGGRVGEAKSRAAVERVVAPGAAAHNTLGAGGGADGVARRGLRVVVL